MAEMPTAVTKDPTVVLDNYVVDEAIPTKAHLASLRKLAANIARTIRRKDAISATVIVEGHTDATGTERYNQQLGARRSEQTVRQLQSLLANEDLKGRVQYVTQSAGEAKPVASNRTKKGRAGNRRVDITLEWVVPVPPKRPQPKPPKPKPEPVKRPRLEPITLACADAALLRRRFDRTRALLEKAYYSTTLYWQPGGPIGLKIEQKSMLRDFTKSVQDKIIGEVGIEEKLFGKHTAQRLDAVVGYVAFFKELSDDIKNERIMGGVGDAADEARRFEHRKLVCKLVANERGGRGTTLWLTYYKDWMELRRLEGLCAESRGIRDRPPSIGPAPAKAQWPRWKRK
jgi:hypothetical protein